MHREGWHASVCPWYEAVGSPLSGAQKLAALPNNKTGLKHLVPGPNAPHLTLVCKFVQLVVLGKPIVSSVSAQVWNLP